VGALTRRKGVDLLIEGLALASHRGGDAKLRLTVVGDGPERSNLDRLAASRGVGDRVVFTGPLPHDALPKVLSQHHLLVMGSYEDHTGRSAIEAMSCGVPVLASARSGIPEILIEPGVNGLVVDPTDQRALADTFAGLSPDLLASLAAGARKTAPTLGVEPAAAAVLAAARAAMSR
jgi:glycosyltransferase involved in cell wall biosynthesis